jgi:hypothetical protein
MIPRAAIDTRVREWGLRHSVVEKDYVLGWLLWGIGRHPVLGQTWIFKGGTCLKKCYIETYRFSEDLDFTIAAGGPIDPHDVSPLLGEVLEAVADASGIEFSDRQPVLKARNQPGSVEGRVVTMRPGIAPTASTESNPHARRPCRSARGTPSSSALPGRLQRHRRRAARLDAERPGD